jgi:hypothetical protein
MWLTFYEIFRSWHWVCWQDATEFITMERDHTSSQDFIRPSYAYLIEKKRDGEEFSEDEIRFITGSILDKTIPDHQLADRKSVV